MITLACPIGSADAGYPVSFGDHQFQPYRPDPQGPWLIDVPSEEAIDFLRIGGFRMVNATRPPPQDVVLMHHPDDPNAVPGDHRPADQPGHWWIPAARVAALMAHGFVAGEHAAAHAPEDFGSAVADRFAALENRVAEAEAARAAEKARAETDLAAVTAAMAAPTVAPASPPGPPADGAAGDASKAAGDKGKPA